MINYLEKYNCNYQSLGLTLSCMALVEHNASCSESAHGWRSGEGIEVVLKSSLILLQLALS